MKSARSQKRSLRKKRGIAWLDVCAILTMFGIMVALAWMGWQRSQAGEALRKMPPKTQAVSSP